MEVWCRCNRKWGTINCIDVILSIVSMWMIIVAILSIESLQTEGRNLSRHCDWNNNIVTIGTVRSLRLEMSQSCCNRLQFVMMLLGFNKKHVVIAPMLICPTLFYLLKFMNVYLMVLWYVTKIEKNIWWILNRRLKSLDVKDSIGSGKKFFPCGFKWEWNSKDKVENARK